MKQSWQLMSKLTNTLNDHAHVRIRTCIENDQSESGCVLGQRATMRYQERWLVHSNEYKICHSYHHSIKFHFQIKHPIMLAPHQNPFYFEWINFANSITWNYENKFTLILKHFKKPWELWKLHAKKKNGINILTKMGFWNLKKNAKDENFDDLKLFKNKIRGIIYKIRLRKIIWKMGFGKTIFKIKNEENEDDTWPQWGHANHIEMGSQA